MLNRYKYLLWVFLTLPSFGQNIDVSRVRGVGYVSDESFLTLPAACASAVSQGLGLQVSKSWPALTTQSLACSLTFVTGGIIQPANGQTVTMPCPTAANQQIFDLSLGGKITFSAPCAQPAVVQWWGAKADWNGSTGTNNQPFFASAAATLQPAGIPLDVPAGNYWMNAAWNFPTPSTSIWEVRGQTGNNIGYGMKGTALYFATGGITISGVSNLSFHDFSITSLAGAAADTISLTGAAGQDSFYRLNLYQNNAAFSSIRGHPGVAGDLSQIEMHHLNLYPATSYSVPPIWFTNDAGGSAMNPGTLADVTLHGSATATAYAIKFDCGANSCYTWNFTRILTEVTPAGALSLTNMGVSILTDLTTNDSVTLTAPEVAILGAGGGANYSYTFLNCSIGGGTTSETNPNILVDATGGYGAPQVTAIGGIIGTLRAKGVTSGWTALFINTRTVDQNYTTSLGTDAVISNREYALNSSTGNGALSLTQNPGSLFFSFGNCAAGTDLAIDATLQNKVSSASLTPNASDVGGYIQVSAGTGFSVYTYLITGFSAAPKFWTVNRAVGTLGSTGGTFTINRGRLVFTNSNAGTNDFINICGHSAANVYAWRTLWAAGP